MSNSGTAVPAGPVATARSFLGVAILLVGAIASLLMVDMYLAKIDRSARRSRAAYLFANGQRLAGEGNAPAAIDRFRSALAIDREHREYQLALARALIADRRLSDADSILSALLRLSATDGEASLMMARALVAQGKRSEATSYYHRAIYGQWNERTQEHRSDARLELIDLLARQNATEALLAELLPLQDAAVTDTALRRRLGHLFVLAHSPARGEAIFREILRHDPQDADAHAGLGEAKFAQGNYRAAQASLQAAARIRPGDAAIRSRLDLVDQVRVLDPMQRGLGTEERQKRSGAMVEVAIGGLNRCLGAVLPESIRAAVDTARMGLRSSPRPSRRYNAVEANLIRAERLWEMRKAACPRSPVTTSEEALELVLAKLAE